MCARCHVVPGTKRCSMCHAQFYCGAACQKADWRDHKSDCKMMSKKDTADVACVQPIVSPDSPLQMRITAACGTWLTKSSLRFLGLYTAVMFPNRDPLVAVAIFNVECVTASAPWTFRITDTAVADSSSSSDAGAMEGMRDCIERRRRGGTLGIVLVNLEFKKPIPGVAVCGTRFVIDVDVGAAFRKAQMGAVVPPGMPVEMCRGRVIAECIQCIHKDKS